MPRMQYVFMHWVFEDMEKIHSITKIFCDTKCLKWMRTQIYYHGFTNLGELIKVDFVSKLRKGLAFKYYSIDNTTATQLKK